MKALKPISWRKFLSADPNHQVVGVDEVGRGCLAGPVYAAAVSFKSGKFTNLVTDSKLLSAERREELAAGILLHHQVGIGFATVEEIDEINILQASLLAMRRAVEKLEIVCGHILIDGNMKIPNMPSQYEQTTVVKGDLRVALISAASIVAKVTRDQLMKDMATQYPHYGFDSHKGYSTAVHKKSISVHGPCIHHRRTFAGVKEYLTLVP
ncbi:MAG: ribonuclease HII [Bdellovibrionaceae bacterium]|nr:ribonuclease HII [Pseudobdellovibrionaceae bacterium]